MPESAFQYLESRQQAMLDTLIEWSEINSGSFNTAGLVTMAQTIKAYTQSLLNITGEVIQPPPISTVNRQGELIDYQPGPFLKFTMRPEAKHRILLCGHMDTVFGSDHPFQSTQRIDVNTLGGPGVADMKGGILVMLNALKAFEVEHAIDTIGWDILLNSEEEIGSLASAPYLADAAKSAQLGLVFEPSMPDGYLAGARRGSGNYSVMVYGKAAHAGREFDKGRNAIALLAKIMTELDQLNAARDSLTLNLGNISGGGPTNIVADFAMCQFNIRVHDLHDQQFAEQQVAAIFDNANQSDGFKVEHHGGFNRPPKPATEQQQALMQLVQDCASELRIELGFRDTGGCCDGNNLLAAGLPNIDTLGVRGGDIHSAQEYMRIDSLVERAKLTASILSKVAKNPKTWLKND